MHLEPAHPCWCHQRRDTPCPPPPPPGRWFPRGRRARAPTLQTVCPVIETGPAVRTGGLGSTRSHLPSEEGPARLAEAVPGHSAEGGAGRRPAREGRSPGRRCSPWPLGGGRSHPQPERVQDLRPPAGHLAWALQPPTHRPKTLLQSPPSRFNEVQTRISTCKRLA